MGFLLFYAVVILFLLKPIFFSRFLVVFVLKNIIFYLFFTITIHTSGIVLSNFIQPLTSNQLELLKKDNNPRLNWLGFIPKLGRLKEGHIA